MKRGRNDMHALNAYYNIQCIGVVVVHMVHTKSNDSNSSSNFEMPNILVSSSPPTPPPQLIGPSRTVAAVERLLIIINITKVFYNIMCRCNDRVLFFFFRHKYTVDELQRSCHSYHNDW